jgi:hypothetical protein
MELSRRRFIPSSGIAIRKCKDINQQFFFKKKTTFDHLTTQKQHCVKQKNKTIHKDNIYKKIPKTKTTS